MSAIDPLRTLADRWRGGPRSDRAAGLRSLKRDCRRLRNQRLPDRLDPLLALHVPHHEIAFELPIGPADAAALGFAADGGGPGDAEVQRRAALLESAELAEQHRAAVGLRPGGDLVEVAGDRGMLRGRAPGDSVELLHLLAGPSRALVG